MELLGAVLALPVGEDLTVTLVDTQLVDDIVVPFTGLRGLRETGTVFRRGDISVMGVDDPEGVTGTIGHGLLLVKGEIFPWDAETGKVGGIYCHSLAAVKIVSQADRRNGLIAIDRGPMVLFEAETPGGAVSVDGILAAGFHLPGLFHDILTCLPCGGGDGVIALLGKTAATGGEVGKIVALTDKEGVPPIVLREVFSRIKNNIILLAVHIKAVGMAFSQVKLAVVTELYAGVVAASETHKLVCDVKGLAVREAVKFYQPRSLVVFGVGRHLFVFIVFCHFRILHILFVNRILVHLMKSVHPSHSVHNVLLVGCGMLGLLSVGTCKE